ncbi:MAG: ABC transporter permease [Vicinamibacterales bacterium]
MARDDIDDELRFHLESKIQELMDQGLTREQAVAAAERAIGDRAVISAACTAITRAASHDHERRRYWIGWQQDLRYAWRSLQRSPAFSVASIATLGLGIGLTTAVFAILHGIVLQPLHYPHSRNLRAVFAVNSAKGQDRAAMSPGDFYSLRNELGPGASIGGYMNWPVSLTGVAEPERLDGALATADLFSTLGIAPVEGRTFLPDEEQPSRSDVAIISARLAFRLGLAGHAAGATIQLAGQPVTVVGVMPAAFDLPSATTDIWIPLALRPADRDSHEARWLQTIARVDAAPGGSDERLRTVMARLASDFPASNRDWTARLVPLQDVVVGEARPTLAALSFSIVCATLVTVVNLVTLVLGRLQRRRSELAVHQALGAGLWRLSRQLGAETVLICGVGGTLGLWIAEGLIGVFKRLAPASIPRVADVAVGGWPIAFAAGSALLIVASMTLIPLWHAARGQARNALGEGRGAIKGRTRLSRLLVVTQAGLAALLVVTAGLLGQAFVHLSRVDLGFKPDHVLTLRISLPRGRTAASQTAYFNDVLERITALPGIVGAGATNDLPLAGNDMSVPILLDQREHEAGDPETRASFRVITPGYLDTLGAPVRGRAFGRLDIPTSAPVAIVNDSLVRKYWPGLDPLGRRIRTSEDLQWRTVVGVVPDVHHGGLAAGEGATIYVPHAQKSETWMTWMALTIRSQGDPLDQASAVRAAIATVDRLQPVSDVRSLDQIVNAAVAMPRLAAVVAGAVSLVALLLAAVGIGAVLSRMVAARRPELALRLALGANPARLMWTPVIEAVSLVTLGTSVGLLAAAGGGRFLATLLFDVSPYDAPSFAATLGVLIATAAIAAIGPSRAVVRVDPVSALRE